MWPDQPLYFNLLIQICYISQTTCKRDITIINLIPRKEQQKTSHNNSCNFITFILVFNCMIEKLWVREWYGVCFISLRNVKKKLTVRDVSEPSWFMSCPVALSNFCPPGSRPSHQNWPPHMPHPLLELLKVVTPDHPTVSLFDIGCSLIDIWYFFFDNENIWKTKKNIRKSSMTRNWRPQNKKNTPNPIKKHL